MYDEDDYLMISGLQHFAYCRRQWALIHIEQQWAENERTIDGQLFHKKAHDAGSTEKRGDLIITRGLHIKSATLGVSGICDVVEFHRSDQGITLFSFEGRWQPYPVEYKKGEPKENNAGCDSALCPGDVFGGDAFVRYSGWKSFLWSKPKKNLCGIYR